MSPTNPSWAEYQEKIQKAGSLEDLEAIEHELFGRKSGLITAAMKEFKGLPPEEIKKKAQELNEQKKTLTDVLEQRKKALLQPSDESLATEDAIDITLELPKAHHGHLHLIPEFIRQVEEVFGRMGFDVARGPEIETEENNFDLLNIPADHPAGDTQDTFWIAGKEKNVLRTHTSPVQIHYMQTHKPPFRMICPGKTYRKDADATHSPMFHQVEGLMIGKDVSLANMKAVVETFLRELISPDVTFRFRTGYFPFVEPGLEVDMLWRGDLAASREGEWLEMGGLGMVHPNVLKNVGIDPNEWQGFAFGFGIERMIMIKHQIPDLRSFYQGDLRFLKQF